MAMYENGYPYMHGLKSGETVYICQCGKTAMPPFCDNSHKNQPGTEPLAHTAKKDETLYICGCGKSRNLPWCDSSHNKA